MAKMKMNPKGMMICGSVSIVLGSLLAFFGIILQWGIYPALVEPVVYMGLDFKQDSEWFGAWKEPPVAVYITFTFFDVENWEDWQNGTIEGRSVVPRVNEAGPYAFEEWMLKKDIIETNNEHLNYAQQYTYYWSQEETDRRACKSMHPTHMLSCSMFVSWFIFPMNIGPTGQPCNKNDVLHIINPIYTSISEILLGFADRDGALLDTFWTIFNRAVSGNDPNCPAEDCQDSLILEVKMIDFMFDTYVSKSLVALNYTLDKMGLIGMHELGVKDFKLPTFPLHSAGRKKPKADDDDSLLEPISPYVGIFTGANGTISGNNFVINNGRYLKHRMMMIEKWNGVEELDDSWWLDVARTPSATKAGVKGICPEIHGSDGTGFPAFPDAELPVWIFISDLCRSLWLDFTGVVYIQGIKAYEYRPGPAVFDMTNPDNYCYCPYFEDCAVANEETDEWDIDGCLQDCRSGIISIAGCALGAPVVMSAPHFLYGDPHLFSNTTIIGLNPESEKHDTILNLETMSGVVIQAHKKIQVSIAVMNNTALTYLENVNETLIFPMFWLDEGADLSYEDGQAYEDSVIFTTRLITGLTISFGLVLGLLIVGGGIFLCYKA